MEDDFKLAFSRIFCFPRKENQLNLDKISITIVVREVLVREDQIDTKRKYQFTCSEVILIIRICFVTINKYLSILEKSV